jgi:hypothetical protein
MFCLQLYALLGIAGAAGPDWGLLPILGAPLFGSRPETQPGLQAAGRAAAEAAWRNVNKPHRLRTHRDAGRERAPGAAGRRTCQAGASSAKHLKAPLAVDSEVVAGKIGTILERSRGRLNGGVTVDHDHADERSRGTLFKETVSLNIVRRS